MFFLWMYTGFPFKIIYDGRMNVYPYKFWHLIKFDHINFVCLIFCYGIKSILLYYKSILCLSIAMVLLYITFSLILLALFWHVDVYDVIVCCEYSQWEYQNAPTNPLLLTHYLKYTVYMCSSCQPLPFFITFPLSN
jgi:hypothetical protein